jgi:hypothetical protein
MEQANGNMGGGPVCSRSLLLFLLPACGKSNEETDQEKAEPTKQPRSTLNLPVQEHPA